MSDTRERARAIGWPQICNKLNGVPVPCSPAAMCTNHRAIAAALDAERKEAKREAAEALTAFLTTTKTQDLIDTARAEGFAAGREAAAKAVCAGCKAGLPIKEVDQHFYALDYSTHPHLSGWQACRAVLIRAIQPPPSAKERG